MGEKLNEVLVNIPLAPHGEIEVLSKWDRVGPELLAALEEMVSQYEEFFEDAIEPRGGAFDEYWNALDAIAKAKGE